MSQWLEMRVKLTIALSVFVVVLWTDFSIAQPDSVDDLYTARAVVTGKDERNRPLGFRLCFDDVLVKVSGDANIVSERRFDNLASSAGQYVSRFSYRDRTCHFDPQKIDSVLKALGRKP